MPTGAIAVVDNVIGKAMRIRDWAGADHWLYDFGEAWVTVAPPGLTIQCGDEWIAATVYDEQGGELGKIKLTCEKCVEEI